MACAAVQGVGDAEAGDRQAEQEQARDAGHAAAGEGDRGDGARQAGGQHQPGGQPGGRQQDDESDRPAPHRTARAIRGLRTWVTDELEHDGVRTGAPRVLDRLLALARDEVRCRWRGPAGTEFPAPDLPLRLPSDTPGNVAYGRNRPGRTGHCRARRSGGVRSHDRPGALPRQASPKSSPQAWRRHRRNGMFMPFFGMPDVNRRV
ncbi:hypothetical protein CLM62_32555 [Streptomyces sp. SA15]|nr:hypothetical protein CLM62_32555 [Streptomyces sp. SA15]